MIPYKVNDRLRTAQLSDIRVDGAIGERMELFFHERVISEQAHTIVYPEAENAFLHQIDDEKAPVGIWQGEYWGKWMISACRVCKYEQNDELREFIRRGAHKLISYQREDGYIGTYRNAEMVMQPTYAEAQKQVNWKTNWNWNIWCRKYTLWGLLECYELLGEQALLDAAARSVDQLIEMLDQLGVHICETGTFFGVASGSILKPVLQLYRHTENEAYLQFALSIADAWQNDETVCAKLIRKSLQEMPPHLWNDWINDPGRMQNGISGKVYETLSCFDGLLELYRMTGESKYLDVSKTFFNLLTKYEYSVLFSVGYNDVFLHAATQQNAISEPCDVIHFIRFAGELYKLTGDISYIDFIELAYYNPLLASITRDGKWGARGVRVMERHLYAKLQAGFKHNHCCVNNMPRGLLNAAEMSALCDDKAIYINLYHEAAIALRPTNGESVDISVGDGYLQYGLVDLVVRSKLTAGKTVFLRVPGWSKETTIVVNGQEIAAAAGQYAQFTLSAEQPETIIRIAFDRTPRLEPFQHDMRIYPLTPYQKSRYMAPDIHEALLTHKQKATLCIGPVLLALSKEVGSSKEDIFDRPSVFGHEYYCTAEPKPQLSPHIRCGFEVTFTNGEQSFTVPMCDYASASDQMDGEDYYYSIFV